MSATRFCPNCGRPVPLENAFCAVCGAAMPPAPAAGVTPSTGGTAPPGGPAPPPPPIGGYPPGYAPPPMYVMPQQANFSNLLSGTFDAWTKNFLPFFAVYFVLSLVTGGLGLVGAYLLLGSPYLSGPLPVGTYPSTATVAGIVAYVIVVALLGWVLASIVLGGVVDFSVRRYRGESIRMQDSLANGLKRVLSILGANLLVTLVIVGVVAVWAVVFIVGLVAGASIAGGAGALGVLLAGLVSLPVMFVVVLYLVLAFSLYAPAIMMEGAHAIDSLRRSWALTKGHKLSIFGTGLLLGFISVLISIAFSIATGLTGNAIVELVASALAAGITGAWFTILTAVAYERIVKLPQPSMWPAAYAPPMPPR